MVRLGIIVLFIGVALTCTNAEDELYSDKYNHIDVMPILTNDKLRQQYYKCFTDQGPCVTGAAKLFKEIFGEALQTNCKKCTEMQKVKFAQIIEWYTQNKPDEMKLAMEKSLEDMKKKSAGK